LNGFGVTRANNIEILGPLKKQNLIWLYRDPLKNALPNLVFKPS
jgi:hypothetical protein